MTDSQKKIKRLLRSDPWGFARRNQNVEKDTVAMRLAKLTWQCKLTYSDIMAVGGSVLLHRVWKAETTYSKAEMARLWKEKRCVDLDWRLGEEMA